MPSSPPGTPPSSLFSGQPDLTAQGFRLTDSGPHTSKTLMLAELETLLQFLPQDSPAEAYRSAIVDDNLLGKPTASSRRETATRLKALHGLDPQLPLFRVLRRLWDLFPDARPRLALLNGMARDPLLRVSADAVLPLNPGTALQRSDMVAAVQTFTGSRLSRRVLDAVARNTASSWTQSGHLHGKVRKVRQTVTAGPGDAAFAIWLGYTEGRRARSLLTSFWAALLDTSPAQLLDLGLEAKRLGLLQLSHGGNILTVDPTALAQPNPGGPT